MFVPLALAGTAAISGCGDSSTSDTGPMNAAATIPGRADFQWTIPKGTAEQVDVGTHDKIFPSVLYARIGQNIRIINEDRIAYTVGPFIIGPGQTLEQTFRRTGTFEGVCTTHAGATFVLIVEE